ncbi:MAG: glycoside hydrolase family 57 protein [Acidilobaceae archaeon]
MHVVLFFELHQPYRLRPLDPYPSFSKTSLEDLFEWELNREVFERVAKRVYEKASRILLKSLKEVEEFKFTLSISGLALEGMKKWAREAYSLIEELAATERVEFVAQTYYHSIAWLIDRDEFVKQILEHVKVLKELTGRKPIAAENTEFIYNNDVACTLHDMGFKVVLTEGVEWLSSFRGFNHVYLANGCDVRVLVRNYRLSDDIGFRFSLKTWDQYPLTADKYASWLDASPGDVVLIAMDYETFGEHHWPETGIYEFLEWLPREIAKRPRLKFTTVSEAALNNKPIGIYDVPGWTAISWADERDLSAWVGSEMQSIALKSLARLYPYARALGGIVLRYWRLLSASDHFYYQALKTGPAGEVHSYFNPYKSPFRAHSTYMYALSLLAERIASEISSEPCKFLKAFKTPPELCFYFKNSEEAYIGVRACSIDDLEKALVEVPLESLEFHVARGDFENWLKKVFVLQDPKRVLERCGYKSLLKLL